MVESLMQVMTRKQRSSWSWDTWVQTVMLPLACYVTLAMLFYSMMTQLLGM